MLNEHPINSARCDQCAREIRTIGFSVDPMAFCMRVRPRGRERFVVPQASLERNWYFHYTACVQLHCVDVLTGVPGTLQQHYLERHWKYADALRLDIEEPSDV